MSGQTISITLTPEQLSNLQSVAGRLNLTVEDLARAGVEDFLSRSSDESFERTCQKVLTKNADLYRRLA
jgi:hypothetical protein